MILKLGEYPRGLPWSPILKLEIAGAKQKFASNTLQLAVVGIASFRRFLYLVKNELGTQKNLIIIFINHTEHLNYKAV